MWLITHGSCAKWMWVYLKCLASSSNQEYIGILLTLGFSWIKWHCGSLSGVHLFWHKGSIFLKPTVVKVRVVFFLSGVSLPLIRELMHCTDGKKIGKSHVSRIQKRNALLYYIKFKNLTFIYWRRTTYPKEEKQIKVGAMWWQTSARDGRPRSRTWCGPHEAEVPAPGHQPFQHQSSATQRKKETNEWARNNKQKKQINLKLTKYNYWANLIDLISAKTNNRPLMNGPMIRNQPKIQRSCIQIKQLRTFCNEK